MDYRLNAAPAEPEGPVLAVDDPNAWAIPFEGGTLLYVIAGLLFVTVSRALRRRYQREQRRARARTLAQMRAETAPVEMRYFARSPAQWGAGRRDKIA